MSKDDLTSAPRRSSASRFFGWGLVVLALIATLYTFATLSYKYSEGERAGILQKFSSKGWVCKTYEGELALYVVAGVAPEVWNFSVRDSNVAAQLSSAVGQRVQLHYSEHPGVPTSCFAETRYFVDRVNAIGDQPVIPSPGVSLAPRAPAPVAAPAAVGAPAPVAAPLPTTAAPPPPAAVPGSVVPSATGAPARTQ